MITHRASAGNGQAKPTVTMRPGEIQLWRLVNATVKAVTTLTGFVPVPGATPPEVWQIAQDGVQFSFDNYDRQPILKFLDTGAPRPACFAPGNRMDLLVKAPMTPGTFVFRLTDRPTRPSDER